MGERAAVTVRLLGPVEATSGGRLYIGDYGTGPSGSYLLLLETTESDYNAYRSDYVAWYESITLF